MWILLCLFVLFPQIAGAVVAMPLGIPSPNTSTPGWDWEAQAPARPAEWLTTPSTAKALWYYVCQSCTGATDTPSTRTGHPSAPRLTIPNLLPAGSVVELHGTYSFRQTGQGREIRSQGTLAQPVFIRGQDSANIPTITAPMGIWGSYATIENLKCALSTTYSSDNDRCFFLQPRSAGLDMNNIVFRNNEVTGNLGGGAVQAGTAGGATGSLFRDIIFYHNHIHHNGGRHITDPKDDQDTHGITLTCCSRRIWVLDNEFDWNGGDGMQINGGNSTNANVQFVYVGRNNSHHNHQSGLWAKESQDVIFSENTVHDIIRSHSVPAAPCFGTHYGATRTWWIFNHCYGTESGIRFSEETGSGGGGVPPGNINVAEQYAIGNYFHNIHTERTFFDTTSNVAQATITAIGNGASTRHFVNNTMYNIDSGFVLASHSAAPAKGEQTWILKNNIIGGLDMTRGWHIRFADPVSAAVATITNTLFSDPSTRIIFSNTGLATVYTSIAAFQAAFPGKCAGCLLGNAGFIAPSNAPRIQQPDTCLSDETGFTQMLYNPAAGCITFSDSSQQNYHITDTSPAMNHGAAAAEYDTFFTLYGIHIDQDLDHLARTSGGTIDIGAYEFQSGGAAPHTCH
jgi:hypothetical protein